MTILSLDLGTQTGWAIKKPDSDIISGTVCLCHEEERDRDIRYLCFRDWLNNLIIKYPDITQVYYEIVRRHLGILSAHVYGGYRGIMLAWAYDHNIKCMCYSPATIKKYITGKGNASKQQVIDAIKERGYDPCDDNEADALAIMLIGLNPPEHTSSQRDQANMSTS